MISHRLLRFFVDVDVGELTLNFTETVRFGSLDATKLMLRSVPDDSDEYEGESVSLSAATTAATFAALDIALRDDGDDAWDDDGYHGVGGVLVLTLTATDLDALKASAVAVDATSTWLAAGAGAVTDMTGNGLIAATSPQKPCAGYGSDTTPPELVAFDIDIDLGTLDLKFSEAVDDGSLDLTQLVLTPDGAAASGFVLASEGAVISRGDGRLASHIRVDLGRTNLHALKLRRIGVDAAWLAAGAGAVLDMAGLPLIRIYAADVLGGPPLSARAVVADATSPTLIEARVVGAALVLRYDEPVDATVCDPTKLRIVDAAGAGDALKAAIPATAGADESELVFALDVLCGTQTCVAEAAVNVSNTTVSTNGTCVDVVCDRDKAAAILNASTLYVTAALLLVRDYSDNPSAAVGPRQPTSFEIRDAQLIEPRERGRSFRGWEKPVLVT